jgi:hypothetical protein
MCAAACVQLCSVLPVPLLVRPRLRASCSLCFLCPGVSRAPLPPCRVACLRRLVASAARRVRQPAHAGRHGEACAHRTPLGDSRATTAHETARAEHTHSAQPTKKRMRQDRTRRAGHRLTQKTHKFACMHIDRRQTLLFQCTMTNVEMVCFRVLRA